MGAAAAIEPFDAARRYRVKQRLAAGGMGDIFLAEDALTGREVAYKRLRLKHESTRARATALFEREYDALARLSHPNVVEVFDYGVDAHGPYYTMELLSGKDLAELAPLPFATACRVLRDVASALGLLHARRMVHRDVSPESVRLSADGSAKLLDFGALSRFGRASEIVGTPSFLAPESLSQEPLDQRADLYALGGLAYWALTRRLPYPVHTIAELMEAWQAPLVPPSSYAPELPRELDELVLSLLAREPSARPATTAHLIDKLTAIAGLAPERDEARVARSYLMHPPLVGRARPLRDLSGYVQEAQQGRGRAVLLKAASGLGRSALLEQLAIDAQLLGATVLRWQSETRDGGFGLGLRLVQQLHAMFPDAGKTLLERNSMLDSVRGSRARKFGREGVRGGVEASERQARRIQLLQDYVLQVSRRAPLVVLIDDLEIADAQSLALIASLARAVGNYPVLLMAALRDGAAGADANAVANLEAQATTLSLEPVTEADIEELVKTVFGDVPNVHRMARWLHAQSGGNPGHAVALCRRLLQSGELRYRCGSFDLPYDVQHGVGGDALSALQLARVSELGPDALALARLLSIQEGTLDPTQLAAASALGARQIALASEELVARGVARRVGESLTLSGESLRSALQQSLAEADRTALHARLARAILSAGERGPESMFAACHHLLRAGRDHEAAELAGKVLRSNAFAYEASPARVPLLEKLLSCERARGRPDEHCLPLLVPLVRAGFWGDLPAQTRHLEAAFRALSNVSGMTLAGRLAPSLGKKLALIVGMLCAAVRYLRIPRARRLPRFADNLRALLGAAGTATTAASSAFDPETAARVVAYLEPLAALSKRRGPYLAREFCVATAELGAGHLSSASRRYAWLLERLASPVRGLDDYVRTRIYDGCLHGRAQAEVTSDPVTALALAARLEKRDPFFAPHVEVIRMTHCGYTGDQASADLHRARGEVLSLRGGIAWSAFTVMTVRSAYFCMLTRDMMGLARAGAELERLAELAPVLHVHRELCRANLELLRGRAESAAELFERVFLDPRADGLSTHYLNRAQYAEALRQLDRASEAKQMCLSLITERPGQAAQDFMLRALVQQCALLEAELGDHARAYALLTELSTLRAVAQSPLTLGALHRDWAQVALSAGDKPLFDLHFDHMLNAFRATKNPALIQQCRKLLFAAVRAGLAASPVWEQHSLLPPANTQDFVSNEALPEVTELLESGSSS